MILYKFILGAAKVAFAILGYYLSEEINCLSQWFERVGVGDTFLFAGLSVTESQENWFPEVTRDISQCWKTSQQPMFHDKQH